MSGYGGYTGGFTGGYSRNYHRDHPEGAERRGWRDHNARDGALGGARHGAPDTGGQSRRGHLQWPQCNSQR